MTLFNKQITNFHHHNGRHLASTRLCYNSKWPEQPAKKEHEPPPKSTDMKTQSSTPTSKLSAGLQSIKNTNKLSTVMSCLKLYFSHITVQAFFYGMTALVGPGLLIFEAL